MRLGLDIDNTITNTEDKCLEYIKKYTPQLEGINLHDIKNPIILDFYKKYQSRIIKEVTLKDNAKEVIKHLHELGYKIIIITARGRNLPEDYKKTTEDYLKKNGIIYDKIILNETEKGIEAFNEHLDYFIDDREYNLNSVNSYHIKCFKYNSNREYTRFPRFNNWLEIDKYFTDLVRGKK